MEKEIKALVFDYGGVLTVEGKFEDHFNTYYAKKHNLDEEKFSKCLREIYDIAKVGKTDSKLVWKKCADFCKISPETFKQDLIAYFGFKDEVYDFVKSLKGKYKLGMISNQIEDWLEGEIKKHKLDKLFEVIVTSYHSKKAKPDSMIFHELLEKLEVKPEETVFIDDQEKNIIVAEKLGFKPILFENLTKLKQNLEKLGVK